MVRVVGERGKSAPFMVTTGVREGCVITPCINLIHGNSIYGDQGTGGPGKQNSVCVDLMEVCSTRGDLKPKLG